MDSPPPDDSTIEAWLAGELSTEEAAEIEAYFEAHPEALTTPNADSPDLRSLDLRSLDDFIQISAEIQELMQALKTDASPTTLAPEWQDILTPSDDPTILGTLKHYHVLEVIATGGMGIVLKARDTKLQRLAALKVLSPGLAGNATARTRFLREARAAAKLEHENILPIYEIFEDAVPWFSMRYVGGGSLQDLLDLHQNITDTLAKLPRLKSIATQTAAALSAAHSHGIVHRDIKPGNILLDEQGDKVWLCDFGIARTIDEPGLTYGGSVAGTPHYMSPEQVSGGAIDGRSDLFSLGSVLYHCATGRPPFEGETSTAVLQKVAKAHPARATQLNPTLPGWFERLIATLLSKSPNDRFRDASELIDRLGSEKTPTPKSRLRKRRLILTSLALVATLLGALQIPGIQSRAAFGLAQLSGRSFIIQGRLVPHATLAEAVKAASDGETILIPGGKPVYVDNVTIPSIKSLTLAAHDPQNRPLLTTQKTAVDGLTAGAPLTLRGLDFQLNTARNGVAIIQVNAGLLMENCTVISKYDTSRTTAKAKAHTIEIRGGGQFTLRDCRFDLHETNLITVRQAISKSSQIKMLIDRCQLDVTFVVNFVQHPGKATPAILEISDSTCRCRFALVAAMRGLGVPILFKARHTRFDATNEFCWFRTNHPQKVEGIFQWDGRDCTFTSGKDQLIIGAPAGRDKAVKVLPIEHFRVK